MATAASPVGNGAAGRLATKPPPAANDPITLDVLLAEVRELVTKAASRTPMLLSRRQAARLLGVSREKTLERLIDTGVIRTILVGKRLKIPATELQRFAAEGERRARQQQPQPRRAHHPRPAPSRRPASLESAEEYRRSMKAVKVSDL